MGGLSVANLAAILLLLLALLLLVGMLAIGWRRARRPKGRPLSVYRELRAQIGRAAEESGVLHIALGSGGLESERAITSLASPQVVEAVVDATVSYGVPPFITVGDPTLLPLAQDALRRAYTRRGLAELYDPSHVRFVAPSPVAYAAGAAHLVAAEGVTANIILGAQGPEVSLITDSGTRRGITQLAAADSAGALAALYPVTDLLAEGEELYAAGAHLTGARRFLAGVLTQDILRAVLVLAILVVVILALIGR
jgi:hypothetical protein